IPVRTKSVARPPALPNSMSVLSLSPTMIVRFGSKSCFARIQSSIVPFGFPMATGSRPRANRSGALIAPAPGSSPSAVGYVLSSFVARNAQPSLRRM
ncbi:hypothetical protein BD414DRAFT_485881, partial [Trametes punicea]